MGGLLGLLLSHQRVGFDTSVFIYHIEANDRWAALAGSALRQMADGQFRGVTSILTLMEITVQPIRLGRLEIADAYELLIRAIPNLNVVELDARIARFGAGLRAQYGIRTPDALQIGAAIAHGATAFVTNDKRLRQVSEINIVILGERT